MDVNVFGAYSGIVSSVMIISGIIYTAINHRRCRSRCCGRTMEVSVDIEHTSPQIKKPTIVVNDSH